MLTREGHLLSVREWQILIESINRSSVPWCASIIDDIEKQIIKLEEQDSSFINNVIDSVIDGSIDKKTMFRETLNKDFLYTIKEGFLFIKLLGKLGISFDNGILTHRGVVVDNIYSFFAQLKQDSPDLKEFLINLEQLDRIGVRLIKKIRSGYSETYQESVLWDRNIGIYQDIFGDAFISNAKEEYDGSVHKGEFNVTGGTWLLKTQCNEGKKARYFHEMNLRTFELFPEKLPTKASIDRCYMKRPSLKDTEKF